MKLFRCNTCGKLLILVKDSGVKTVCCNSDMKEIKSELNDNINVDKHLPVIKVKKNIVEVVIGSIKHPLEPFHYIMYIMCETTKGLKVRYFRPEESPKCEFILSNDEILLSVYAYCNIHGLWRKDYE